MTRRSREHRDQPHDHRRLASRPCRRGSDAMLLHDRRAPDAIGRRLMLSRTRSSSACISVMARSSPSSRLQASHRAGRPVSELDRRDPTCRWQPFATANSIVFEPCNHVGCVEVYTSGCTGLACSRNTVRERSIMRRIELAAWQASDRRRAAAEPSPRIDPFGRMPRHQPSWEGEVRLSEISLLEPLEDIRRIFRQACDARSRFLLRIPNLTRSRSLGGWTSSALDSFVGPKT